MSLSPRVIALLGFGEAGSAIARGLCAESGWRGTPKPGDNAPRRVIAIDPALDKDARGTALGKEAHRLEVAISDRYSEALSEADLLFSADQSTGFGRTLTAFVPKLKAAGVSDAVLHRIMVNNPRQFLACVPKRPRKR